MKLILDPASSMRSFYFNKKDERVNVIQAVGPYNTQEQARKDYVKRINAIDNHSFARLALLRHPDNINGDGVV